MFIWVSDIYNKKYIWKQGFVFEYWTFWKHIHSKVIFMWSVFFTLIYFSYHPSANAAWNWPVFLGGHIHTYRVQLVVSDSSFFFFNMWAIKMMFRMSDYVGKATTYWAISLAHGMCFWETMGFLLRQVWSSVFMNYV